ncbi:MAG: putative GNAT superfamily acetyltransferase, partial [Ilumatobacter sp.]
FGLTRFAAVHDPRGIKRRTTSRYVGQMIRRITDDDLDRVLEINAANVPEVGEVDEEQLRFIVSESALALVVESDDEIAGFCLVLGPGSTYDSVNYLWFMDRTPDALYLDRVAFDQRFQGRGLGSVLYAEVSRLMSSDHPNASELTLEVNIDPPNEPSLSFHRKHGFTEVGRQLSHGIEVSLMSRPVSDGQART